MIWSHLLKKFQIIQIFKPQRQQLTVLVIQIGVNVGYVNKWKVKLIVYIVWMQMKFLMIILKIIISFIISFTTISNILLQYTIKNFLFLGNKCVTLSEGFKVVCLTKNVLKTALSALNNLRGNNLADTSNCVNRYAA